jgi:hypothetical protein
MMSAFVVLWNSIVGFFAAAPSTLLAAQKSESWSDRISRERGWPTEPRSAGGIDPSSPDSSSYLASASISGGGDCGGDACSGSGDSG